MNRKRICEHGAREREGVCPHFDCQKPRRRSPRLRGPIAKNRQSVTTTAELNGTISERHPRGSLGERIGLFQDGGFGRGGSGAGIGVMAEGGVTLSGLIVNGAGVNGSGAGASGAGRLGLMGFKLGAIEPGSGG